VIVASGHTGESMANGFRGRNVQYFLEKPFGLRELIEVIEQVLPGVTLR
jgi:hypothetical protein